MVAVLHSINLLPLAVDLYRKLSFVCEDDDDDVDDDDDYNPTLI